MSQVVLEAARIGKKYRIRGGAVGTARYRTLRDEVARHASALFRRHRVDSRIENETAGEFWALRDLDLQLRQGEVLGVIGGNGAGKSTLLKIISRITQPTVGRLVVMGRVGSLLEVGTGFHPELSGRENVYLNGAILGMTRREICCRFDAIVEFSGVERFLDMPVKHYSSGMYVRLAFAVASHLEPDILIVDEVLAVGDVGFQQKCLDRMREVTRQGSTVLLVSHNLMTIEALCTRAVHLSAGTIIDDGEPRRVIANYLRQSYAAVVDRAWSEGAAAPGNEQVRIRGARVLPDGGSAQGLTVTRGFVLEFDLHNLAAGTELAPGLQLRNQHGLLLFESAPVEPTEWLGRKYPVGRFRYRCHIPGNLLNNGTHRVTLVVATAAGGLLHVEESILAFEVLDSLENRGGWLGAWDGAVRPILHWETMSLPDADADADAR